MLRLASTGRSDRKDAPTAAEAQQFSVKLSFANFASSSAERLDIGAPSGNQVACQKDGYGRRMVFHIVNAGIPMSRLYDNEDTSSKASQADR